MRNDVGELPALTGLRGFAALWVLLFHVFALSGTPALHFGPLHYGIFFALGLNGVDVFFCLSAFLLTMPYARWRYGVADRPDTTRYLLRRVLRIYPAYLFQLFTLLAIAAVFGYGRTLSLGEFVAHQFLWLNLGSHWVAPLVGVWFTLPVEFGFYLMLPFLAPLLDRKRWPWMLLAAIAVTIAYRTITLENSIMQPVPERVIEFERLPGRIDQFVIGMLAGAAYIATSIRGWRPRRPDLWFWAGLCGIVLLFECLIRIGFSWEHGPMLFIWHGMFSVGLVPLLLACAWGAASARRIFGNRVIRYVGEISFGVYLWHMPILSAILPWLPESLNPQVRFWLLLALVLAATFVVAHLSYLFVERPWLRRAHRKDAVATESSEAVTISARST